MNQHRKSIVFHYRLARMLQRTAVAMLPAQLLLFGLAKQFFQEPL